MECQNGKLFSLLIASILLRISQGSLIEKNLPTLIREKRLDVLDEPEPTGKSLESSGSGETAQKSISHKYNRDYNKDELKLDKDVPSHLGEHNDSQNMDNVKTIGNIGKINNESRREDTSAAERTSDHIEASTSIKRHTSSRTYYSRRPGKDDKIILPGIQFDVVSQERKLPPPSKDIQKQIRLNMKRKKRRRLGALKKMSIERKDVAQKVVTQADTEPPQTSDEDNSGESSTDERQEEGDSLPTSSRISRLPKNFSLVLQAHAPKALSISPSPKTKVQNLSVSNKLSTKPSERFSLNRPKRLTERKASRVIDNLLDTSSMKLSSTVKFTFKSPYPSVQKPTSRPPTMSTNVPTVSTNVPTTSTDAPTMSTDALTTQLPSPVPELSPSLKEIPSEDLMMLNDFFNHAAAFKVQQMKVNSSPTKRLTIKAEENPTERIKQNHSDEMPRAPVRDDTNEIIEARNMRKESENVVKDDGSNSYAKELLDFQRKTIEAEEKRLDAEIASAKHVNHVNHNKTNWDQQLKGLNEANQDKQNKINELFHTLSIKEWKHNTTLSGQRKNKEITTGSNENNNGGNVQQLKKLHNENQEKQYKIQSLFNKVGEEWKQPTALSKQDANNNDKVTMVSVEDKNENEMLKIGIKRRRRKMIHRGELGYDPKTKGGNTDEIMETAFYDKDQPTPSISPSKGLSQERNRGRDRRLGNSDDVSNGHDKEFMGPHGNTLTGSKHSTPTRSPLENKHVMGNDNTMHVQVGTSLEQSLDELNNAKHIEEKGMKDDSGVMGNDNTMHVQDGKSLEQSLDELNNGKNIEEKGMKDDSGDYDDDDDVETTVKQDDDDDDDDVSPSNGRNPALGNSTAKAKTINRNKTIDISYDLSQIKNMDHIKDDIEEDDSHKNNTNNNHNDSSSGSHNVTVEELPQDNRLLYILTGDPEKIDKIHKQQELEKQIQEENKRKMEALVDKLQLNDNPNQGISQKGYFNKELNTKLKDMEVRILDAHQKVSKELEEIERHLTQKYEKLQDSITRAKGLTKDMDSKINETVLQVIKLAKISADKAKKKIKLVQKAATALTAIEKKIGANETRNVAHIIKSKIAELPVSKYRPYQRIIAINSIITKMDGAKILAENKANTSFSTKEELEKNMAEAATNVLRELESTEKEMEDDTKVEMEDEREANRKIEDAERRNFKVALKSGHTLKRIEGYLEQLEKDELKLRNMKTLESW